MARPLTRALTTAALTTAIMGVCASAASADHWWGRDASGDVRQYAYSPEPPPCGTVTESTAPQDTTSDIVGLSVRHEGPTVELRAHFEDLTVRGERQLHFDVATDGRDYEVSIIRWSKRRDYEVSVARAARPPTSLDDCGGYSTIQLVVPCPEAVLTWSSERDVVTTEVPRSCLGYPRWVKAGVRNIRFVNGRLRYDAWAPGGADDLAFFGPFGPRVRHSR